MSNDSEPLVCILCDGELHLSWTLSAPLNRGELSSDADPYQPGDAVVGEWKVDCDRGHVVLVPGDDWNHHDNECDGTCDHDASDELRTWRGFDVARLAALLGVPDVR